MKERSVTVIALAMLLGVLLVTGCSPAEAQLAGEEERRTVSVSGSGSASAEPDRVVLRLGVEVMADSANAALSQNSQRMQAVIDGLQEAGIPAADIRTQAVQVRPEYRRVEREPTEAQPRPTTGERELVGYVATNVVEASSQDLGGIGTLIDSAVQAGANRVEDIRFEVSEPSEVLARAREGAWQDAEQKALQLTELAGVQLGEVLSIDESTSVPRPVGLARGVEEAAAVPIEPGTEQIQVDLRVTWALE